MTRSRSGSRSATTIADLGELNGLFTAWLESVYHRRRGGSGAGMVLIDTGNLDEVSALKLDVKEPTLRRLARRAEREGVSVDALAARLLDEAADQDPYEFIGAATGGPLYAERVDDALAEKGFGKPRS